MIAFLSQVSEPANVVSEEDTNMANIWLMYEGQPPTVGGPAYNLPLESCVQRLGLASRQWVCELSGTPQIDDPTGLGSIKGYKHVVCEVSESEGAKDGWKPGFYRLDVDPGEVARRLGPPRAPWGT